MRVGIIGAGVAGLATAKTLMQAGHDVVVLDKAPDVGGVWSSTRRYPGLTTQSAKATYALSDFPMPRDYPEWPTGAQVQAWLADYAAHFGVDRHLRLNTEVTRAVQDADGWTLELRDNGVEQVDRLVVANGVFCEPLIPAFPGLDEFTAAGGRVCAGTDLHDAEDARDRDVLVVGYGKSACDVTVPVSKTAASTHVIARQLLWKVPRKIGGFLNFKFLLLTRMGEALFRYIHLRGLDKFLHGPGNPLRRNMINSIGSVSKRQFKLERLGLVPAGTMEGIVKGAIGLATEGFFEGVADGSIVVHRDTTITRLLAKDGRPHAELSDGTLLPASLVVCATGFTQGVPFLDQHVQDRLLDERSNFMLYRQILPLHVPGLYFNGYNSSFFSPLNAEMAAVWIAAHLAGAVPLPDPDRMRAAVVDQLAFMDTATNRHHSRGTKIIPFSLHNVDEVLNDLDLNISRAVRASHWLNPVNPAAYRAVTPKLIARLSTATAAPTATAAEPAAAPTTAPAGT
ncbi:NAD(P)/FAD-dependent oxidoreductase [Dactylosporangium sp. NPDC049525]|uniref:flavin-containing monooxygenase n=1 Tax=Dactylosporangium sp. NPDC049525 TaxID=3154730 RepID=UPI0034356718